MSRMIAAYVYEAGLHCPDCAAARFSAAELDDPDTADREGNPVGILATWDTAATDCCDDCLEPLA